MKERNDIDQFFKQRLDTSSTEETEWNVPGEDIWEAANIHFPKKKNRRFPFMFIILGLGLIAMLYIATNQTTSPKSITESQNKFENSRLKKPHETAQSKSISKTDNQSTQTNLEPKNSRSAIVAEGGITANESRANQSEIQKKSTHPTSNNSSGSIKGVDRTYPFEAAVIKEPQKHQNYDNLKIVNRSEKTAFRQNQILINTALEGNAQSSFNNLGAMLLSKDYVDEFKSQTDLSIRSRQQGLNTLNLRSLSPIIFKSNDQLISEVSTLKVKRKQRLYKWEFGLSHSPFILNPFDLGEINLETGERLNLTSNYLNLNTNITKRLSRRLSVSSGMSWSELDVEMDFSFSDAYSDSTSKGKFKERVEKNTAIGSLTINDASSNFEIDFIPGSEVVNGDTLNVTGFIPIKLTAVQIPLMVNYHFKSGKIGWLLHAGISLDIINAKIDRMDFQAFKDRQLVTEPIVFNPIDDTSIGISGYVGGGLKYYIGQHINLGVSAKIDVTGIIFSRYELGVYYGF